jgi:hypothetical protein
MSKFGTSIEEISGLVSFWVGLVFWFMAGEMAFNVHNAVGWILVVVIVVWSLALLVASHRGGRCVVLFRIVSVVILVIGTVVSAIFLPLTRLRS